MLLEKQLMEKNMNKKLFYIFRGVLKIINIIKDKYYTSLFKFSMFFQNVESGKNIQVKYKNPSLWHQYGGVGHITIGSNVTFISYGDHSYNCRCKIMVEKDANLTVGNNTGFNGILIYCQESITIGNNVNVGGGTRIFDTDHHPIDWQERRLNKRDKIKHAPIVIEDDVFIGAGCYIMKGVTIGEKSIIAAGSVVTKSIPKMEVWGGNPARFIKKL